MSQNRRIARNVARTRMHAMGMRRVCSKGKGAKVEKKHHSYFAMYWREYV